MSSGKIPIIDFGLWVVGTSQERDQLARDLSSACRHVGFVYLVNHGIDQNLLTEAFAWSKKFFDLPMEKKMLVPHPPGFLIHRGYSWPGLEKVSQQEDLADSAAATANIRAVPDVKESFEMGSEELAEQPNVWPPEADALSELSGFRAFMTRFYKECAGLSLEVIRALASGIQLSQSEEAHLVASHAGSLNNQLRLLHYPPVSGASLRRGEVARMPAHSDWGTVTLLFQDRAGGLQVEDPGSPGCFVDAPPVDGAVVVNVGDALMRWTNGYLKSTLHRVGIPPHYSQATEPQDKQTGRGDLTPSRYSIPYFVSPNPDAVVDCFASCVTEDRPQGYERIIYEDYRKMRASTQY
ncbi:hypothetical protein PpBr36_04186 [Pyricularia pennisetigena]|uniref:hypothetical protein n=1 Tax=Pyricularia pennisetigena TaxID=1578925 RepID=UPI00114EBFF4|nr:hypothetical protein PpBr36_04186 [Pyricularia pennisetigena]TLS27418.1 hypothetical protein PpBr36_04186 [Pyricularia pennisetigena]